MTLTSICLACINGYHGDCDAPDNNHCCCAFEPKTFDMQPDDSALLTLVEHLSRWHTQPRSPFGDD